MSQLFKGYVRIWNNARRVWEYEHRLTMEALVGRPLLTEECVHHINGDRADNRPENLRLIPVGEHSTNHWAGKPERLCSIEGCDGIHHAKGLCNKHYMRQIRGA